MARPAAWRPQDEALLTRLEDEQVLERVWHVLCPGAPLPHPRAAGLIWQLRQSADGDALVQHALLGDASGLARAIEEPDIARVTPIAAHHLALLLSSLAQHVEPDRARAALSRSIGLWLHLGREREYLRRLAHAVVGSALPADQIDKAADAVPIGVIAALGERARGGARVLSPEASMALEVLARVPELASQAQADGILAERARLEAARVRAQAVDDAIARVDEAIEEARLRDAPGPELVALFAEGGAVWRWAGRDENVERFLIERITPFCWDQYRERRWADLRALLGPLADPMTSMAARIGADASKLAYAAPCAQYYVFLAELAPTFDQQLALAERAVGLCATHRNGRLVLADLLCERGLRTLDNAMPWGSREARLSATRDIRRAQDLFPDLGRLAEAKRRLEALGEKGDD